MDIEFFQLKGYVGSCAGQFQAGCSSWIFPGSVCSTVSHFAMKTKSLSIHGILRLQKWECQHGDIDSFFPHWRRCVVCGMWDRLSGTRLGRCVRSFWNSVRSAQEIPSLRHLRNSFGILEKNQRHLTRQVTSDT